MKMEKLVGGIVCLGMVAALSVPMAQAKAAAAPAAQAAAGNEKGGMHGDRLQAAVESLNLTDDQKGKVKDIFADAKTKRQAVFSDSSLSDDQKKAKMKELHEGTMTKLNGVLTPDQQTELKTKLAAGRKQGPTPDQQ
jgi:Spy/CpxP family protein refolding chaperone